MSSEVITIVVMSDGSKYELYGTPAEIAKRMSDKDGKLRSELVDFGTFYLNPKQVAAIYSGELERK